MPLKPEIAGGGLNEYQIIKHGRLLRRRQLIQTLCSRHNLVKGV
jgi:hypothetical protein